MTESGQGTPPSGNPLSWQKLYLLIPMIREFFCGLVKRAKEVATALRAQCSALVDRLMPEPPVMIFMVPGISPATGIAMKMSRRYRRTSDHSPVFSLYTFFGDR